MASEIDVLAPEKDLPPVNSFEKTKEEKTFFLKKPLRFADHARDVLSGRLISISDKIDSFLGSKRADDEINGSRFRIRQINTLYEDGSIRPVFETKFKLDLPKTNKRLSLVIESETDNVDGVEREVVPLGLAVNEQENQDTSINSAVQWVIKNSENWHIRGRVGLQLKTTGLNPNTKLRIRRLFVFSPWKFRITETLFWYFTEGAGQTTRFDLERPMIPTFFFRASNQTTWFKKTNIFSGSQKLTIFHNIGEKRLLFIQTAIYADNDTHLRVTAYAASAHYRQLVYKDWLYAEITPMALFPDSNNFEFTPSISLAFDMAIGAPH